MWGKSIQVEPTASTKVFRQEYLVYSNNMEETSEAGREHGADTSGGEDHVRLCLCGFHPHHQPSCGTEHRSLRINPIPKPYKDIWILLKLSWRGQGHHTTETSYIFQWMPVSPQTQSYPSLSPCPSHPLSITSLSYPEQFHLWALQFSLPSNHYTLYTTQTIIHTLFRYFSSFEKCRDLKDKDIFLLYMFNLYE